MAQSTINFRRTAKPRSQHPEHPTKAGAGGSKRQRLELHTGPPPKEVITVGSPTDEEHSEDERFVPVFLHQLVQYKRKGEAELTPGEQKAYNFIKKHFVIPADFDANHKFGALSGVSYEARVISAYMNNLLELKEGERESDPARENRPPSALFQICYQCGKEGHLPKRCPDAF